MSRQDEDIKDLMRLIRSICDYAKLGMDVSTFNNCNNCADKKCHYKPKWGDMVRWNCPLWKGTEDA